MASLVKKYLSENNLKPANQRYNEGTDIVQFTPDGGVTWTDDPSLDPRTSSIYQLAANPTSNPKCDAAERAIDTLKDEIDTFILATSIGQAANALLDLILVFVPGFGLIVAVIWAAIEALLAIGTTAIALAFTTEVYETLKCLWLANVGEDGIMTEAGMIAWQDAVQAEYPTDAVIPAVISILVDKFGLVHLNNAAVKRTETGDCIACPQPWCAKFNGDTLWQDMTTYTYLPFLRSATNDPAVNAAAPVPTTSAAYVGSGYQQGHAPCAGLVDFGRSENVTHIYLAGTAAALQVFYGNDAVNWTYLCGVGDHDVTATCQYVLAFAYDANNPAIFELKISANGVKPFEGIDC